MYKKILKTFKAIKRFYSTGQDDFYKCLICDSCLEENYINVNIETIVDDNCEVINTMVGRHQEYAVNRIQVISQCKHKPKLIPTYHGGVMCEKLCVNNK